MGHVRLGTLPKTKNWRQVVDLISEDPGDLESIASETLNASRDELDALKKEPTISYCFWLLTRITWFARHDDFEQRLEYELGIDPRGFDSALGFISSISDKARQNALQSGSPSSFKEMSNSAMKEALVSTIGHETATLFGTSLKDIQIAARKYSSKDQFGRLARLYYSSFLSRFLTYVVDKEAPAKLGEDQALRDSGQLEAFTDAVQAYAWQTATIIEEFSAGWYSKRNWLNEGEISLEETEAFNSFALEKLRMEFAREGDA